MKIFHLMVVAICILSGLNVVGFAQQTIPIVSLSIPDVGQLDGPRNGASKIGTNTLLLKERPRTVFTGANEGLESGSIRINRIATGNLGRLVLGYTLQYHNASNANLTYSSSTGVRFTQAGLMPLPNTSTTLRLLPSPLPVGVVFSPPFPPGMPVLINGLQGDLNPSYARRSFINTASESQPGTIVIDSGATSSLIDFTARFSDQTYCCNPALQGPRIAILRIFPLPNENPPSFQVQRGADSAFVILTDPPNVAPVIMNRIPDLYVTTPNTLNPLNGALDLESPTWRSDMRPGTIFYDDNYDPLSYTVQVSDATSVNARISTNNPAVAGRTALLYSVLPGAPSGRAITITLTADDRRTERLGHFSVTNFTITPLASIPTTVALSNDIQSVIVSPNPVSTTLQIHGKAEITGVVIVRLFNSVGVEMFAERFTVSEGAPYSRLIDIRHLSSGMYIAEVEEGANKTSRKIVKQ